MVERPIKKSERQAIATPIEDGEATQVVESAPKRDVPKPVRAKDRPQDGSDIRDNGDSRDTRDSRDSRDSRDTRDSRDSRDTRDSRDSRESRDTRDSRDSRDNRDSRDDRRSKGKGKRGSRDDDQPRTPASMATMRGPRPMKAQVEEPAPEPEILEEITAEDLEETAEVTSSEEAAIETTHAPSET